MLQRTRQEVRVCGRGEDNEEAAHRGCGARLAHAAGEVRYLPHPAGRQPDDGRSRPWRDGARWPTSEDWFWTRVEIRQGCMTRLEETDGLS